MAHAFDPAGDQAQTGRTALLGQLGALVIDTETTVGYVRLAGHLPSAQIPRLAAALPDLTGGEGILVTRFDHYAPMSGQRPPTQRRRGPDPAERESWFRTVPR